MNRLLALAGLVLTVAVSTAPAQEPDDQSVSKLEQQLGLLNDAVRRLQADKALLEARLKEALATQPAVADPRELAKAQERVQLLLKENDLLRASLAQRQTNATPAADPKVLEETKQALAEANRNLAKQTTTANALAAEKKVLQARLDSLSASSPNPAGLDAAKKALDDANRKLADQTEKANTLALEKAALQSRVWALTTNAPTTGKVPAEIEPIRKPATVPEPAISITGKPGDLARQLAQAQARIAALQSDAEILRLEKIALQNRVKALSAGPAAPGAASPVREPEAAPRPR